MTRLRAHAAAILLLVAAGLAAGGAAALAQTGTAPPPLAPAATAPLDPAAAAVAPVCDRKLCIGVRSHARPFAYHAGSAAQTDATSGPLSAAGYSGYIIRICDAVLQELVLEGDLSGAADIGIVDIDAARTAPAAGEAAETGSRLDLLGRDFDILCDPATITNTRRSGFVVSPPLYLTGISFLRSTAAPLPKDICRTLRYRPEAGLIGVVGGTTAGDGGVEALVRAGVLPALNAELNNYLAGRPICDGAVRPEQFVRSFATHSDAARAFCGQAPDAAVYYYLGDLEIVTAHAGAIRGCQFEKATQTYTNDRYAIFAKTDWAAAPARARLVARFFEVLSQKVVFSPSLLDKAFQDTFIGQRPSRKLEVFFWSIRGEP